MNHVTLKGRISREPEIKTTASGTQFARLSIAVDRYAKAGEQRTADFIPCMAWGKTAEFIGKYFVKGQEILAEGRIQTGSYEKDGKKIYTTDVVIDRVEFCGKAVAKNATTTSQEDLPF